MKKFLQRLWYQELAIDLGTANTLIYVPKKGVVLNEPSVVALRKDQNKQVVQAVGKQAKAMLGRAPLHIKICRPLKDGVIADFVATQKMLQAFISKLPIPRRFYAKLRVVVCVPCQLTELERRAIEEAVVAMGAKEVHLIAEPLAAAMGAGLDVTEPKGSLIVDIGGGTTEIAVISLAGVVHAKSLRLGGDSFDQAIMDYIQRHYGCLVGESTAERIKFDIGAAYPVDEPLELVVRGRSEHDGVPVSFSLNSNEILEALSPVLQEIVKATKQVLAQVPPELVGDVAETCGVLTGGGALLRGLSKLLSEELGFDFLRAEDPLTCVAKGAGKALAALTDPKVALAQVGKSLI